MSALRVLSGREASIFACEVDTLVAPVAPLPPVARTDAVLAFDQLLAVSPRLNRVALRAAVLALELAPLVLGYGARLRRLDPERRAAFAARAARNVAFGPALEALAGVTHLAYYGDAGVSRVLGYEPRRLPA